MKLLIIFLTLTLTDAVTTLSAQDPEAVAALESFNRSMSSLRELYAELDGLPKGELKNKSTFGGYRRRMKVILTEMHDSVVELPVSETTKVCLDYLLHKGCDICTCVPGCCEENPLPGHKLRPEDVKKLLLRMETTISRCPLPVRLAVVHDLRKAGIRDQGVLEYILNIPAGMTYTTLEDVDWSESMPEQ